MLYPKSYMDKTGMYNFNVYVFETLNEFYSTKEDRYVLKM